MKMFRKTTGYRTGGRIRYARPVGRKKGLTLKRPRPMQEVPCSQPANRSGNSMGHNAPRHSPPLRRDNRQPAVQGTIPMGQWRRILDGIESRPWRRKLHEAGVTKQGWFHNEAKATFYRSAAPPERRRFLDIGAGSGIIAQVLAAVFDHGVAADRLPEAVRFMRARFSQDRVDNLQVVRCCALSLPFEAERFNLVVANGVLEWVAAAAPDLPCGAAQRAFLEEIHRCTAPGGVFAMGIENRWALGHLRGRSPHGEPPFVALLPRALSRIVTKKLRGTDYRNYIYSYFGYRRLLKQAGFGRVDVYLAVPNYYNPVAFVKAGQRSIAWPETKKASGNRFGRLVVNLIARAGLLPLFWPAYFIRAEKQRSSAPGQPTPPPH